ncbi:3'-5' exoribonuclease [Halobacillus salinarum]|uniref:3'-5' exoribonuclease n=1 Tax=Halobacillus salinarum TaxID=2932257 RepID=A0ABY4EKF0_9BACI|nr:exonuclease domain-containing protein [Halobacillus salinarum]UOQ44012.1 3'-5' exoribonuclease [Halobacillus salinarum]
MNFVAIDFETANSSRSSVCSIGLIEYEHGRLADEYYRLVKPKRNYFHSINTSIHGITKEDVRDEKEFNELWGEEIKEKLEGKFVVAHNASFDMSVLRKVLDDYQISYPELTYNCTVNLAKKTWPHLKSYNLKSLAKMLGIHFEHHHALEDAQAAAIILMKACEHHKVDNVQELQVATNTINGRIYPSGYEPARLTRKKSSPSAKDFVAATSEFDVDHPMYQATFAFTGTLQSLKRREAMQKVVSFGGLCTDSVQANIDYLVVGNRDYLKYKQEGQKTSKLKKAEALREEGLNIEIITEEKFLQLLG